MSSKMARVLRRSLQAGTPRSKTGRIGDVVQVLKHPHFRRLRPKARAWEGTILAQVTVHCLVYRIATGHTAVKHFQQWVQNACKEQGIGCDTLIRVIQPLDKVKVLRPAK